MFWHNNCNIIILLYKEISMKNFYYAAKQVFKFRWMTLIKLFSLTLGLMIAGFTYTYVAFLGSFDTFMSDSDRLHSLQVNYDIVKLGNNRQSNRLMAAVIPTLLADIPQIECGTRFNYYDENKVKIGDRFYDVNAYVADSLFFKTMGYKVLSGDPLTEMSVWGNAFVSSTLASNICGEEDPIGKSFLIDGESFTIRGVFEDIPQNSSHQFNMVVPLINPRVKFDGGDSWFSYVKLRKGVNPDDLISEYNRILTPHMKIMEEFGYKCTYFTEPIAESYYNQINQIYLILSVLSIVIILVSGFNYVLMTLSSLSSRAKEMGVHKANGANKGTIFSLIIWETVIYLVLASLLSGILLWAFRGEFENIAQADLWSIFSVSNFWAIGLVFIAMLIVAGVIPAWLFAKVPVTQVFRTAINARSSWKKGLLFFQFLSSAFVLCFVGLVIKQYNEMTNQDLGYDYKKLVVFEMQSVSKDMELLANELKSLNFYESSTQSGQIPLDGLSGAMVKPLNNQEGGSISVRYLNVDTAFTDVYGIKAKLGHNKIDRSRMAFVNEEFIEIFAAHTKADPLGFEFVCSEISGDIPMKVSGVMDGFRVQSMRVNNQPTLLWVAPREWDNESFSRKLTIRLNEVNTSNMEQIRKIANRLFPDKFYMLNSYSSLIFQRYEYEEKFKDTIAMVTWVLLLITVMGVIGYIATEIKRRSKEIAVRRVHGANAWNVIFVMIKPLFILASIGSAIGLVGTYYMFDFLLKSFSHQTQMAWWVFALTLVISLGSLVITVILQSWKIANSDPARSIKSE